ncbi:MAG: zinc ribbon domain-containing protein [Acidimicrobiia bacterium]
MADSPLETLLVVQEHDTAADRLRHRRESLAERAELRAAEVGSAEIAASRANLATRRAEVDGDERRLGDEVASIAGKATEVEKSMYSGEISSPRELQAMQADVEQLRKKQGLLEDRELELMETREQLDAEMGELDTTATAGSAEIERLQLVIAGHEAAIDAELATELEARTAAAAMLPADVVTTYEKIRKANGVGAARLVGMSCQACHLTIPSTEVDNMRRAAHAGDVTGAMNFCDNCGAILVLS